MRQPVKGCAHIEIFPDRELFVQNARLKDDADLLFDLLCLRVEIVSAHGHPARIFFQNGTDDVDRRALSRAVDAEKGKERTLFVGK